MKARYAIFASVGVFVLAMAPTVCKSLRLAHVRYAQETLSAARGYVLDFRRREGRLPKRLDAFWGRYYKAVDLWGTSFRYETRGDQFVIGSAGPDRRFDAPGFWAIREQGKRHTRKDCFQDGNDDLLISDLGFQLECSETSWKPCSGEL